MHREEGERPGAERIRPPPEHRREQVEARHRRRPHCARRRADHVDVEPERRQRRGAGEPLGHEREHQQHHQGPGDDHHVEPRDREDVDRPRLHEGAPELRLQPPALAEQDRAVDGARLGVPLDPDRRLAREGAEERRRGRGRTGAAGTVPQPRRVFELLLLRRDREEEERRARERRRGQAPAGQPEAVAKERGKRRGDGEERPRAARRGPQRREPLAGEQRRADVKQVHWRES